MSLYVCYDDIVSDKLWSFNCSLNNEYGHGFFDALDDAMDLLNEAPGIEIIRCKKCKHFGKYLRLVSGEDPGDGYCTKFYTGTTKMAFKVSADHYCGFAEEKEDEE